MTFFKMSIYARSGRLGLSEIFNDLAVVFDGQYFAQIRRYYDELSERHDIARSCHDGQLDLFDADDVAF